MTTRVIIVGGGVAGLSTATFLRDAAPPDLKLDVRVLESSGVPGGKVRSELTEGFVHEWGPHGFLDDGRDTLDLIHRVGLESRRIESRLAARRRFILVGGRLEEVPHSLAGMIGTRLLPPAAKLRLLREPFVKRIEAHDESVAAFARRRFGDAVVPALVEPLVTGIHAGDAAQLSFRSAFPRLHEMEREHGSLLRAMARRARERRRSGAPRRLPTLCSFPTGMGELTNAVARHLGDAYRGGVDVVSIDRDGDGYALDVEAAAATETLRADVLVLAAPSHAAARLADRFDPDLAATFRTIPYAPVAVVCLVFPRDRVGVDTEAFGFLCARSERRRVLGCVFASSIFAGHAPDGMVSLRVMLGGALDPDVVAAGSSEIVEIAAREVGEILRVGGEPIDARVFAHHAAIPQYRLGHQARLAAVDAQLRRHPNLFVTGAAYRGASVNDCIANGRKTATHVLRHLLMRAGPDVAEIGAGM